MAARLQSLCTEQNKVDVFLSDYLHLRWDHSSIELLTISCEEVRRYLLQWFCSLVFGRILVTSHKVYGHWIFMLGAVIRNGCIFLLALSQWLASAENSWMTCLLHQPIFLWFKTVSHSRVTRLLYRQIYVFLLTAFTLSSFSPVFDQQ